MLIKILFLPISVLVVIIILLLRPFLLIRLSMIPDHRLGHFTQDIAIYILDRENKKNNKINVPLDFFAYGKNKYLSNSFLKKKWNKKINIGNQNIIFSVIQIIKYIHNFLSKENIHDIKLTDFDDRNLIHNNPSPLITFTDNEKNKAQKILKKMGINYDEKFILIMIRDKNYLDLKFPDQDWKHHDYRNFDLEDFIDAINMLIDKGYKVIRMGTNSSEKFPLKRDKFIDYAKSEYRSDLIDFYLCANCYFSITTIYGLDSVARLFKKPTLGIQYPFANSDIFNTYDLITLPTLVNKKDNTKVSLNFFLKLMLNESEEFSSTTLKKLNLKYLPNSSEEIKEACIEMLENQEGNKEEINQEKFWTNIFDYLSKKKLLKNFDISSKRTMVCKSFYLKYKNFLID